MHWYKADLHIHTVLSPCAELSMGPREIVNKALENKLDIIAITDHNSAENVPAVIKAAKNTTLSVFAGMEVYTHEEAHVICLFDSVKTDFKFQEYIYNHLPTGEYNEPLFGPQIICDENENILGYCNKILALPVDLNINQLAEYVQQLGGILYPAHIDRKANSLLYSLGFIPNNLPVKAVEITQPYDVAVQKHGFLKNTHFSILRSSDAHDISQLGEKYTYFKMRNKSFTELKLALDRQQGRRITLNKDNL